MTDPSPISRQISPPGLGAPAANYAHAVVTNAPARWLHTSGVVPVDADGTVPDALQDQARVIWQNLSAMLAAAEMQPHHVVSVVTYVVEGQDLATAMAARDHALGGHLAASTLVVVPSLAQAAWKMEIAIVAAAPATGDQP